MTHTGGNLVQHHGGSVFLFIFPFLPYFLSFFFAVITSRK